MTVQRLRILHLLGNGRLAAMPDGAPMSGVVRAVLELAKSQATRGHDVTVAGLADATWTGQWHGCSLVGLQPVRVAKVSVAGRVVDLSRHFAFVFFSWRHRFDVVHGHLHPFLRWVRGRIKVVHFHADPFFKGTTDLDVSWSRQDFCSAARHSDLGVSVSGFLGERVRTGFEGMEYPLYVVENGVDPEYFSLGSVSEMRDRARLSWNVSGDAVVCLFVGAITPEKGLRELARGFVRAAEAVSNLVLVIVGEGSLWGTNLGGLAQMSEYEGAIRSFLEPLVRSGRVFFIGKVAANEIPVALVGADFVVVPSVRTIVQESFGLVALEAMAVGRPVIVSQSGNLPYLVSDGEGEVVDELDDDALVACLVHAATDAQWRSEKGLQARVQARSRTWSKAAERLDGLYAIHLKKGRGR